MITADLQAARDAEYSSAYRDWIASLPPADRARLAAEGLAEPDTSRRTSHRDDDLAMSLAAAPELPPDDLATAADERISDFEISNPKSEMHGATVQAADILASFCARIRAHPNPLLAFDAACYASGLMGIEGLSETALAARHGVTRAAFSKLVIQWSQTFGLPPSRGMRSKRARHSYRKARLNYLSQSHLHHDS
jgi:hypothetical protein